jgi:hypothetical protein
MKKLLVCLVVAALAETPLAAPAPPPVGDIYGWELPRILAIDSIDFPKRLVRNRSYGRVVAEVQLRRDGERQDLEFTYVENGELLRWAEKIITSAKFSAARLDGSPVAARVPIHVAFFPETDRRERRIEVWYPTDSADYQSALVDHFLLINNSLAPLLIRSGSFDWVEARESDGGVVTFEVYVQKDGSRERGKLIASPGDAFTRHALAAALDMQILPPRYQRRGYGCWTRVLAGFCPDWDYPTLPVDRALEPYRGWPAPVVAPVGSAYAIPPQVEGLWSDTMLYNQALLNRASELVLGLPLYNARVDTTGHVVEWFRARPAEDELLATDWEYLSWATHLSTESGPSMDAMSLSELARLAGDELERLLPHLRFRPARDARGHRIAMWVTLSPSLFR